MNIYARNLSQLATLYARTGVNSYGEPSYGAGTTIRCRWQDVAQNLIDAQGQDFVSRSVIYVGAQAKAGDRIAYGSGASFSESDEIKTVFTSPSLDGRESLIKVAV